MLKLLDQDIICLPVHDSFIVIADYQASLRAAMVEAFAAVVGGVARLKAVEIGGNCFEPVTYPNGDLDVHYLRSLETTSPYHVYHRSFFEHWKPTKGEASR